MTHKQLLLENQLCFPVYTASRLIIREYQPHLDKLGITYPQYLALMILWERDRVPVKEITQKLMLGTSTVTPLLKRMEAQGIITRERSRDDERIVVVTLTTKGRDLQTQAAEIPYKLAENLTTEFMSIEQLTDLKDKLLLLIEHLSKKEKTGKA